MSLKWLWILKWNYFLKYGYNATQSLYAQHYNVHTCMSESAHGLQIAFVISQPMYIHIHIYMYVCICVSISIYCIQCTCIYVHTYTCLCRQLTNWWIFMLNTPCELLQAHLCFHSSACLRVVLVFFPFLVEVKRSGSDYFLIVFLLLCNC